MCRYRDIVLHLMQLSALPSLLSVKLTPCVTQMHLHVRCVHLLPRPTRNSLTPERWQLFYRCI